MNQAIKVTLALVGVAAVCFIAVLRESPPLLDWLSNWAAARSWGIKCAEKEFAERQGG